MTDSTRQGAETEAVLFEGVFDKPVRVEFSAERQSDFGGLPLLAAIDRQMGLTAALTRAVGDARQPGKVTHSLHDLLRQRVFGIALGLPDVRDAARLRDDPAVRLACDRELAAEEDALASASVLCRLENAVRNRDLLAASFALAERVIATQAERRRGHASRVTLDFDPADDPTFGQQQLSFFNGHYDNWCYLPVFGFLTFHDAAGREEREQHLVAAVLRPGNAPATQGFPALLARVVALVRSAFPGVRVRVRLDGGFASGRIFDFLEDLGLEYVVNMGKNPCLVQMAAPLLARARAQSAASGGSARVFGEGRYAARGWRRDRRVVIKAEVVRDPARPDREPRDNPRFVVTNLRTSPEHVYQTVYCRRGEIENRIKELKDGLRVDLTSCTEFCANQFRVLLTAAAYMLLQELRRHAAATELGRAQVVTLRERLLLLGARLAESTRRITLQLSRANPFRSAWLSVARAVGAAPA